MKNRIILCAALAVTLPCIYAQGPQQNAGKVLFERFAESSLDPYDAAPNSFQQQWFLNQFFRMDVFSPFFDANTSWYPRAAAYHDLYGVEPTDPIVTQHPDWIMRDATGLALWIPFACDTIACARYAGDFSNPNFRAWWITNAAASLKRGYMGLWLDDVDMDMGATNAFYGQLPPIDFTTKQPMDPDTWRAEMAAFLEQIRAAFPGAEIIHNAPWYSNSACCFPDFKTLLNRDLDPNIRRQIAAADVINKESGIASDLGLTGGTGLFSLWSLFNYFDRVHAAGKHISTAEYVLDRAGQEYGLAGFLLVSAAGDRYGDRTTNPANWWNGLSLNLGDPYSARVYNNNGLWQRNFTGGVVLFNEPGAPANTVSLPEPYTRLDGSVVTSVTLGPKQAAILLGAGAPGKWISDMTPVSVMNGYGPLQTNTSTYGNRFTLNGNTWLKGLGSHAYAEIHYNVAGGCQRFVATVGVDDEVPAGAGSADFQVTADGVLLFDSGRLTGGSRMQAIDVNIIGRSDLGLIVTDGGAGNGDSHADWANARVECQ